MIRTPNNPPKASLATIVKIVKNVKNNIPRVRAAWALRQNVRAFVGAGVVTLVACNTLLGTEAADPIEKLPEVDSAAPPIEHDAEATDAREEAAAAAPYLEIACGDRSGLAALAPWPTGGACNTRISRAKVPALVKPKIRWRYAVPFTPPLGSFRSGPAIGADGTVYSVFLEAVGNEGGYSLTLIAVRDGTLRFKTALPINSAYSLPGVPTLAADGTIYVTGHQQLVAFSDTGVLRWTYPLEGDGVHRVRDDSPTVLADGTIVVVGTKLTAVHPNGTKRWELLSEGSSFVNAVAVTPSGLLVVDEAVGSGGVVSIVSPEGQRRATVALSTSPDTTPVVTGDGTIVVQAGGKLHVFDEKGTVKMLVPDNVHRTQQRFAVFAPPRIWIAADSAFVNLIDLNLTSGAVTKHEGGPLNMAGAGDGSLVVVTRQDVPNNDGPPAVVRELVVRGLDPTGSTRWQVTLEDSPDDLMPPALGADGTVFVTLGGLVYAIGD